jgi:hypothetical protein
MFRTSSSKLLGNSLYQDYSLGKGSQFYHFKSNYLNSDFLNPSPTSSCATLLSLNSTSQFNVADSRIFSGQNALISRNSASHITSTKLLNVESVYFRDTASQSANLLHYYKKFSFYDSFLNTSLFVNNQFFFFNNQKSILDSGLNAQDLSLYFNFICHDRNLSLTQYSASSNASFFTLPAALSLAQLNSTFFSKFALQQSEKIDSITSNLFRFTLSLNNLLGNANSSFYNFFLFADQDFKR